MQNQDGTTKKVVAEVKPQKEYQMALLLQEKKLEVPDQKSLKKLKRFEYDLKMAQKNLSKWETMIEYCQKKGWEFIVITELHLKRFNL
jgi:hypothetical protein